MSKVKIKQEIQIECSSEQEVKDIRKVMRLRGFHSSGSIYFSFYAGKYSLTMYSDFKKYKL